MRSPKGFGQAGRAVWRSVLADLEQATAGADEAWELDARELVVLEAAARQADLNRQLEELLAEQGLTVVGSMGQARLNPAATELRQGRIALEKLLAALALPDEDGRPMTAAQKRAQHAARVRYARRER